MYVRLIKNFAAVDAAAVAASEVKQMLTQLLAQSQATQLSLLVVNKAPQQATTLSLHSQLASVSGDTDMLEPSTAADDEDKPQVEKRSDFKTH